jgi:hypothetical protein
LRGDIIGGPGIIELGASHVRGETMHYFERTGVVYAEIAGAVSEGELLVGTSFETSVRFNGGRTHFFG